MILQNLGELLIAELTALYLRGYMGKVFLFQLLVHIVLPAFLVTCGRSSLPIGHGHSGLICVTSSIVFKPCTP